MIKVAICLEKRDGSRVLSTRNLESNLIADKVMRICLPFIFLHLLLVSTVALMLHQPARCSTNIRQSVGMDTTQPKNDSTDGPKDWKVMSELVKIESPWLTIIGERIQDDRDQLLDYWRVSKDDSAVVVTIHRGRFVFPRPVYRVGVGQATLDFPGGRIPRGVPAIDVAPRILQRELGIDDSAIRRLESLNSKGWPVNSSFSNQKLFGFVVEIKEEVELDPSFLHQTSYFFDDSGEMTKLLEELTCLQCRAVLMEWLAQRRCGS